MESDASPSANPRSVRDTPEPLAWENRLNRQWPERSKAGAWISSQLAREPGHPLRVVELASGAGWLAEFLLRRHGGLAYCGFDISPQLVTFARRRMAPLAAQSEASVPVSFRQADLNQGGWVEVLARMGWAGQVDAVVSLQALHDLGGVVAQETALQRSHGLLRPGGLLVYADLLLEPANPHPRRLTQEQHIAMVASAGFGQPVAAAEIGPFVCLACRRSNGPRVHPTGPIQEPG